MQKWISITLAAMMLLFCGCKKEAPLETPGAVQEQAAPSSKVPENAPQGEPEVIENAPQDDPQVIENAPQGEPEAPEATSAPTPTPVPVTEKEVTDFLKGDNPDLLEKLQ